jgi:threonine/homoserine/homoserine lactone efflux protein
MPVDPLLAGLAAGYAVAIPVGAVAVLIIEIAARRGFAVGAAAGLGAATADLVYASIAVVLGSAIAATIAPWAIPIRWASALVLAVISLRLILGGVRRPDEPPAADVPSARRGPWATWGAFFAITLLNPTTVAYFAALVLGLPTIAGWGRAAFAVGVFLASASWQLALAAFGALVHRHASPGVQRGTTVLGGLLILAFAASIARSLVA